MKISKATRWILVIGIFAILLVTAGVYYGRQKVEHIGLRAAIAQTTQDYIKYTAEKKDLETRKRDVSYRINSSQDEFRKYTESIEIDERIVEAARDADVKITMLRTSLPEDELVINEETSDGKKKDSDGITLQVFTITTASARGEVVNLIRFSQKVSDSFSAAIIESIRVEVTEEFYEGESDEEPEITLRLKIYYVDD